MKDRYRDFSDLRASRPHSYKIEHREISNDVLIFIPHGGGIEPGTTELCKWFSRRSFSFYSFTGIGVQCKELHLTSTKFDEPKLLDLLGKHTRAVSFHGMTNEARKKVKADIFVGGLDLNLRDSISAELKAVGFLVSTNEEFPYSELSALNPKNVTNRCISKKGVQIELSASIRRHFFSGNYRTKTGRNMITFEFNKFCNAVRRALEDN